MGEVWRWQFLWNSSLFKLMEVKKWWWKVVVVAFWGSASGCWMASIGWCWGDLCWCVEVSLRPDFCCCCWWQLRIRVEWGEKASIKTQREDDSLTMAQESSPPLPPQHQLSETTTTIAGDGRPSRHNRSSDGSDSSGRQVNHKESTWADGDRITNKIPKCLWTKTKWSTK